MSCVYSHLFFCHPYATCCPEYTKARHLIAASLSCCELSSNSPAWKKAAGRQAVGLKFDMPRVATFCGRHDGQWCKIFLAIVIVRISLFCSLHTYPPVSALLNPTTAALVPRPVGSSTLLLVILILLSVLQVACAPCVRITTCSFVGSLV
jgi:hypothetical protein